MIKINDFKTTMNCLMLRMFQLLVYTVGYISTMEPVFLQQMVVTSARVPREKYTVQPYPVLW